MKYLIIDLESSGLSTEHHELTEISVLDCQSMEQVTWMVRIKHPEKCDKKALFITNKTAEELCSRGRYVEEVLPEVKEFILRDVADPDEVVMIAHNASFDRRFCEYNFAKLNIDFPIKYWICSLNMSKAYTRRVLGLQKTSHALNDLLVTANVKSAETQGIHGAAVDVRNTFRLWKKMTQAGISNSEFIKMSPAYLIEKPKKTTKKNKKEEYTLDDIMTDSPDDSINYNFEEESDD